MSNYRYRIDGEDIILTEPENDIVKAGIKAGASVIYLRDDNLAINVNFIRLIKKTDQTTESQDLFRYETKKLEAPEDRKRGTSESEFDRLAFCQFRTRHGWEHSDYCIRHSDETIPEAS